MKFWNRQTAHFCLAVCSWRRLGCSSCSKWQRSIIGSALIWKVKPLPVLIYASMCPFPWKEMLYQAMNILIFSGNVSHGMTVRSVSSLSIRHQTGNIDRQTVWLCQRRTSEEKRRHWPTETHWTHMHSPKWWHFETVDKWRKNMILSNVSESGLPFV